MSDAGRRRPLHLPFRILDVFAEAPLCGNPLAVFDDAGAIDGELMQRLASETNLSETTFVTGGSAADGFDVRIFTPSRELPFAGHPTLGTAAVLLGDARQVRLNLAVGPLVVRRDGARLSFEAPPVTMSEPLSAEDVCALTGLAPDDLHPQWRARRADVGPRFTLVPLATPDALRRCALDLAAYRSRFGADEMAEVYAFVPHLDAAARAVTARLLFDAGGVREDPATGSAAACLGHYLAADGHLPGGDAAHHVVVSQGRQIGRPSELHLSISGRGDAITVRVGGSVQAVASGAYTLPG
jgi:trans-2,3-dihydro-3-hydroxyanthranilate isomerase